MVEKTMGMLVVAVLAARTPGVVAVYDYINFETDQFVSQGREPFELALAVSMLESYILALDLA